MDKTNCERTKAVATDVQGRILGSGQKIVCLIDAPTSKPKQVLELIGAAKKAIGEKKRFGLLVTVGKRTDLLNTVLQNLQLTFTDAEIFYVMLTQGTSQGARSMPSFCVYCRGSECKGDVVPCSLALNKCRAKASESLRLRCCSQACPFREKMSISEGDDLNPQSEIKGEDRMEDDGTVDIQESDDEIHPLAGAADSTDGTSSRKDLFPFSRPVQWYEGVVVFVVEVAYFVVCCLFFSVSVFLSLFLERIFLVFVLVSIVKSEWSGPGRILEDLHCGHSAFQRRTVQRPRSG